MSRQAGGVDIILVTAFNLKPRTTEFWIYYGGYNGEAK